MPEKVLTESTIPAPQPGPARLVLPATSANLGPGFDAAALAMTLYLTVEAEAAKTMSITATGRDAALCGALKDNLLIDTYTSVLTANSRPVTPLRIEVENEIPLGMGCGSSAAALLAGIALAAHFGSLGWSSEDVLREACIREGHPDNVAACWLGGLTLSAMDTVAGKTNVNAISIKPKSDWRLLLVMPSTPLSTKKARGLLPETYSKADAIFNVQRIALLTAAFAEGNGDLLQFAMQDKLHQPYRAEAAPLLPLLEPLAGKSGILGVALSGAGPSVLLVLSRDAILEDVEKLIAEKTTPIADIKILPCGMERRPASCELDTV
jgi:homoserine kinase